MSNNQFITPDMVPQFWFWIIFEEKGFYLLHPLIFSGAFTSRACTSYFSLLTLFTFQQKPKYFIISTFNSLEFSPEAQILHYFYFSFLRLFTRSPNTSYSFFTLQQIMLSSYSTFHSLHFSSEAEILHNFYFSFFQTSNRCTLML